MRKHQLFYLLVCFFLTFLWIPAMSQEDDEAGNGFDAVNPMEQVSNLGANFGMTSVGGQNYIGFRINPEISLLKFGVGLDIPIMFNLEDGKFRTDEFKDGVGIFRMIRYVRYGVKKRDPFYIRLGDISGAYLGYGMLLNNYTNSYSYEKRKLGISMDILIKKKFGLELVYSDVDLRSANLFAIRPYIRPFGATGIPIVKTLDIGISYVTDHDVTKLVVDGKTIQNDFIVDGMGGYGADMGLYFINNRWVRLSGFMQYAGLLKNSSFKFDSARHAIAGEIALDPSKEEIYGATPDFIRGYKDGTGFSTGLDLKVNIIGETFRADARIERLFYTDYFKPQFFDAIYEMDKDSALFGLALAHEKKGIYGSLSAIVLQKISLTGSVMFPDKFGPGNPGAFQLYLDASRLLKTIALSGTYIKGGLTVFAMNEVFKLDQRSLLNMTLAYKIKPWLLVGIDYRWTWSKTETGEFKASNYIMPHIGLRYPLGIAKEDHGEEGTDY